MMDPLAIYRQLAVKETPATADAGCTGVACHGSDRPGVEGAVKRAAASRGIRSILQKMHGVNSSPQEKSE
jgi:hypothetical protein